MGKTIRWGMMGAGDIIRRWQNGARQVEDMELVAVASRTRESAERIAKDCGIPEVEDSYEALARRDDIDACYIPVPHSAHKELAILAMEHGKSVLVEKPIAVSAAELEEMIACAKKNKVLLMEAFWTRFFPMLDTIRALQTEDGIGEIRSVDVRFSYRVPAERREGRALNPAAAGGGLLDVGVYPLTFVDLMYDEAPEELTGYAAINSDEHRFGVDEQAVLISRYSRGRLATMACGVRTKMEDTARIYGTNGMIILPLFWKPTRMTVIIGDEQREHHEPVPRPNPACEDEGFQFEIRHFGECMRKGLLESPVMTWDRSRRIMGQCDALRKQWGLRYPFE